VPVLAVVVFLSISSDDDKGAGNARRFKEAPPLTIDPTATYTATIETTEGTIVVALDAANAPTSVNNFVFLARKRFYDGLIFNRASTDFVIQTGSPNNTQAGGPGYSVLAELPTAYEIGSVAWAKGGAEEPGTASSQFFIATGENATSLPPEYGILGIVTSGLEVAQTIEGFAPATGDGPLTTRVRIRKVTITETPAATTTSTTAAP
jgi:cyclophilin family peptidyl-prolyl cis-trans isomerase